MDTTDETNGETADAQTEEPQLPARIRNLLERVGDEARERPLVALAAATGIGFVIGRGLPRFGALAALLGVGGLVGYAATTLRSRALAEADDGDEDTDENDASSEDEAPADTSDDAHDISVSSSMPDANRPRRKPKKPSVVGGA